MNWLWKALLITAALVVPSNGQEEKFEFQAEVSRMMDIIINSLYQKKEVFMREVISNGADALDKIRFLSLQDQAVLGDGDERKLEMRISFDEEARTLTIRDTGIGLTRKEMIDNLGTVAKSGTTNFVEQLASMSAEGKGGDLNLIGQFGVGFYSVYLVADKVEVRSKSNEDDQYVWESTADSTFTVKKDPEGNTLGRGTEITLHLKEDALEYSEQDRLEKLVQRYSEFVGFPIYLRKKSVTYDEPDDDEDDIEDEDEDEDFDDEEEDEDDEDVEPKETITWDWVLLNDQPAIWTRSTSDVTDAEYQSFFKALSKGPEEALTWSHFKAEGEVEFKSILFIPKTAPRNLYDSYNDKKSQIKLYVRKVLIKDDYEELLPPYLNFIKGVVDSDDLPLSVSRETLQQQKAIKVISKKLVRKALDMITRLANAEEDDAEDDDETEAGSYSDFYKEYSKSIKLGVIDDSSNKKKLAKLLRFKTTHNEDDYNELVSLEAYVERMPDWQSKIFFVTGDDVYHMRNSALVQQAKKKKVEVLLLDEPVDEYLFQSLTEYEGKKFQHLGKEGKFGDETEEDKQRDKQYKKEYKGLTKYLIEEVYNRDDTSTCEKIVVSSKKLGESTPAVIVAASGGNSARMDKIQRSQTLGTGNRAMPVRKVLELNPRHPIVNSLKELHAKEDFARAEEVAWLLYDAALVGSGFEVTRVNDFSTRIFKVLQRSLELESLTALPEIEIEEEEEEDDIDKEDL